LELYLGLAATIIVSLAAWHGIFPRFLGFIFSGSLISYTVQSFRLAGKRYKRAQKKDPAPQKMEKYPLPVVITMTVVGLGCLPVGSYIFIKGAVDVARHWGVSELIIGLTLAAVGTSLPELASCLAAIRQRQTEILAGNIIGSNLFNLLMVLGFCGMLIPFPMSSNLLSRDIPIMFSFSVVLFPILAVQQGLSRLHGFILLVAYLGYLCILR
jgi:cation:H+ antiporter